MLLTVCGHQWHCSEDSSEDSLHLGLCTLEIEGSGFLGMRNNEVDTHHVIYGLWMCYVAL